MTKSLVKLRVLRRTLDGLLYLSKEQLTQNTKGIIVPQCSAGHQYLDANSEVKTVKISRKAKI